MSSLPGPKSRMKKTEGIIRGATMFKFLRRLKAKRESKIQIRVDAVWGDGRCPMCGSRFYHTGRDANNHFGFNCPDH